MLKLNEISQIYDLPHGKEVKYFKIFITPDIYESEEGKESVDMVVKVASPDGLGDPDVYISKVSRSIKLRIL